MSIPLHFRFHVTDHRCEKYLLRKAFESLHLLPEEILWRKKEAFSDGVTSQTKSWYEIIQEYVQSKEIQDFIKEPNKLTRESVSIDSNKIILNHNTPKTDEQKYYRKLFQKYYTYHSNVIPYFWMPKFINATDSSARTLEIYKQL